MWLVLFLLVTGWVSCARQHDGASKVPAVPLPVEMAHFEHVFVVVEENENYDEVIGNTTDLPYLNSLAAKYGVATNYYANTHPSLNNYFYLTAGHSGTRSPWIGGLADLFPGEVAGDNIASILSASGKTWKAYAESIPGAGYVGPDHFPYVKRHNPFAYFENVRHGKVASGQTSQAANQAANIVPFDSFADDLKHDTLPDYSFIAPNLYNDGHHDPVTQKSAACGDHRALQGIDTWLKANMEPLIKSETFKRSGLLVIVFDEGCEAGSRADWRFDPSRPGTKGGGHIPALIISSRTPAGTTRDGLYHHESILRLSLRALGVEKFPGRAKTAPDMDGFFSAQIK
jgi:phosphatidylinositol-3-phosphatase